MADLKTALGAVVESGKAAAARRPKREQQPAAPVGNTAGQPATAQARAERAAENGMTPEALILLIVNAEKRLNEANGHPDWKGCHWIFSGARDVFKRVFPDLNDREVTDAMVADGKLFRYLGKGGPTFYLPEDWRQGKAEKAPSTRATALAEMLTKLASK